MPLIHRRAIVENLRGSFWVVPALSVLAALVAGVVLPSIDLDPKGRWVGYVFAGGGDGARGVLEAIAGSVITVTSLTFSLTIVTLQLASSQFSPRLLRTFLRDLRNQSVLGILLATFVYSLTVLRTVQSGDTDAVRFVPRLAVTVSYLLVIASVAALVWFIQHIVGIIRIDNLMVDVRDEVHDVLDETFPAAGPGEHATDRMPAAFPAEMLAVPAERSGYLLGIDLKVLAAWCAEHELVVYVDIAPGDWVTRGVPWARIHQPSTGELTADALRTRVARAAAFGDERTQQQDAGYGITQLVDIVAKALSPGINDPTTAVNAIHLLSDVMADLVDRPMGAAVLEEDDGTLRVVAARPTFATILELVCGPSRRYGAADPSVLIAITQLLSALALLLTDADRRSAVRTQAEVLELTARDSMTTAHDLDRVMTVLAPVRAALA